MLDTEKTIIDGVEWANVLAILAHELRSPAAVISGYARMLSEGRLSEHDRQESFPRIERAAARVAIVGQQASDLSRWLTPDPAAAPQALSVGTLVERAVARVAVPDRVSTEIISGVDGATVLALDRDALPAALGLVIDAISREVVDDAVQVLVRVGAPSQACDILVGPADRIKAVASGEPDAATPLKLERELGLGLVVAVTIFRAHEGQVWTIGGQRGMMWIRLRPGR